MALSTPIGGETMGSAMKQVYTFTQKLPNLKTGNPTDVQFIFEEGTDNAQSFLDTAGDAGVYLTPNDAKILADTVANTVKLNPPSTVDLTKDGTTTPGGGAPTETITETAAEALAKLRAKASLPKGALLPTTEETKVAEAASTPLYVSLPKASLGGFFDVNGQERYVPYLVYPGGVTVYRSGNGGGERYQVVDSSGQIIASGTSWNGVGGQAYFDLLYGKTYGAKGTAASKVDVVAGGVSRLTTDTIGKFLGKDSSLKIVSPAAIPNLPKITPSPAPATTTTTTPTPSQIMSQQLLDKLMAGGTFSDSELSWAKINDPTLYSMIAKKLNIPTALPALTPPPGEGIKIEKFVTPGGGVVNLGKASADIAKVVGGTALTGLTAIGGTYDVIKTVMGDKESAERLARTMKASVDVVWGEGAADKFAKDPLGAIGGTITSWLLPAFEPQAPSSGNLPQANPGGTKGLLGWGLFGL